jgi:DNA-binding transcriptional regulator YiaG
MSDNTARFFRAGQGGMAEPYHYKMCGLDNIYLLDGVECHDNVYGRGVSIHDAENLHRTIGLYLIMHKKAISPKEIRFLRKQMDLTQAELGKCLGVTDQSVARYEKAETEIPGPVDRLIRFLFAFYLIPADERAKLLEEIMEAQKRLQEMDDTPQSPLYFQTTPTGWDGAQRPI